MIPFQVPGVIEAALRAIIAALTVWAGLRLFRIRNVLAQKSAWCLVLAAALLMPLLMHWQWTATVKLPAALWSQLGFQRTEQPESFSAPAIPYSHPAQFPVADLPAGDRFPAPSIRQSGPDPLPYAMPQAAFDSGQLGATTYPIAPSPKASLFKPKELGWLLYLAVSVALLARLFLGLGAAAQLWLHAQPVPSAPSFRHAEGVRLRSSTRVASPVAIGSGVILPADYAQWNAEKLRIVLAHESSHVRQGDFYLQFLAGLYAALFWFSPLGWWMKRKLSDLGEAISDRAGLEEAASRSAYARILLEFAALPRPTLVGVAMARTSNLSLRIERLLNESSFRHAFAGNRRPVLLAVLVVPIALFASTAFIRVEAATATHPAAAAYPAALAQVAPQQPLAAPSMPEQPASMTEASALPPVAMAAIPAAIVAPAMAAAPDSGFEATFDRTLSVSGKVELSVATGSGNIHLTRGSGNSVHIFGRVRVNRKGSEQQVREIAANPPIDQAGNIIHIGSRHDGLHNISIDYEIQAPANAMLAATTGSGDITDEGVGENAKLNTGSGNIHATGLANGFVVNTGSGDIYADQTGSGDVKAETGSGNIEIKGGQGSLLAETGSGDIKASGTPSKEWKLETGSGDVEFWAGSAPLTLDAATGSGGIHTDKEMLTQGTSNHHHIIGKINGGGPTVRIETGSGDIRIH